MQMQFTTSKNLKLLTSIETSTFPDLWKIARVAPIYIIKLSPNIGFTSDFKALRKTFILPTAPKYEYKQPTC